MGDGEIDLRKLMTKSIHDLRNIHSRKPIAVLGGGPNLPDDLIRLPVGTVKIGINNHAARITAIDYLCFADSPKHKPDVMAFTHNYIGRRLTFIKGFSDWDIDGADYLYFGKTFPFAVWAAEWMGGDPVLLCGFDCFTTGNHFHDDPDKFCFDKTLMDDHLSVWKAVKCAVAYPDRIRVVSGPLIEFFGKFKNDKQKKKKREVVKWLDW